MRQQAQKPKVVLNASVFLAVILLDEPPEVGEPAAPT